jgi:DNA-binding SARP family transcriptional activator
MLMGALSATLEPDDLHGSLSSALDVLRAHTGADEAEILLSDPDTSELVLTASAGAAPTRRRRSRVAVPLTQRERTIGSIRMTWTERDVAAGRVIRLLERAARPISMLVRASLASVREAAWEGDGPAHPALRRIVPDASTAVLSTNPPCGVPPTICAAIECRRPILRQRTPDTWPAPCRKNGSGNGCCLAVFHDGRPLRIISLRYERDLPRPATRDVVILRTFAREVVRTLPPVRALESSVPPRLEIRCFGAFDVRVGDVRIPYSAFTRRGALTLLKMLVLQAGKPISRGALAERIWPDVDLEVGANRLHGLVHALRAAIEPEHRARRWRYVLARDDMYYFDAAAADIDVLRFRQLLDRARGGADDAAIAALEEAASLYTGDLFEDDPCAEWCDEERVVLRERFIDALDHLANAYIKRERTELAVDTLRRALRMDPLREDLHCQLVEVLLRLQRRKEAREQYHDCVRILRDELGAEPMPETRRLGALANAAMT